MLEGLRNHARLRRQATRAGALLAAAGVPLAAAPPQPEWARYAAIGLCCALALSVWVQLLAPRWGRLLATVGLLGTPALAWRWLGTPARTLAAAVLVIGALALLHEVVPRYPGQRRYRHRPVRAAWAAGAARVAAGAWVLWLLCGSPPGGRIAVAWALAVASLAGVLWALYGLRSHPWSARGLLAGTALASALTLGLGIGHAAALGPLGANCLAMLGLIRIPDLMPDGEGGWDVVVGHPERLFVGTFALLSVAGTLALTLPFSAAAGSHVSVLDAAFTATSAVCVTGLIVLDTPVDFSGFGQGVILLLIQLGGLGVMTFYTFAFWALKQRMSMRHESAITNLLAPHERRGGFAAVRRILLITAGFELAGALVLTLAFLDLGDGPGQAVWRGVFTSVSAFCNAGFALQSDSLVPYREAPLVLHTVGALVVVGGLSPLALVALPGIVRGSVEPVSVQARLCLVAAAVLLSTGFVYYLAFEWETSLRGLGLVDKLHNAWFQSVTLRTAGFNSVDLAAVRPPTMTLMLIWMFIGGSPGGTAGGVKTTTVSVLLLGVVNSIRGRWTVDVMGRRVSARSYAKATTVVVVAALGCGLATLALQLTQDLPSHVAVFEVVSALGTVGLSIGGTAGLDGVGRVIIIACMFVGRVGGLTLLMFLSARGVPLDVAGPEEEVDVG